MGIGRIVGYALLGLVDAFVPSAIAASMSFEIGYFVPSYPRVTAALAVAGLGLSGSCWARRPRCGAGNRSR